jgi:glycosyltransferase involved in cell wall biosynthesis
MSVSIIIPTYNRKKFERLIEYNINCQDYSNILEVVIADDGDEDQNLELKIKYPIKYIKCARMKIGEKRNILVSQCKGEYIAHMDTDDIYFSTYISYTMSVLERSKKDAAGTADMIFIFANGKQGGMRNPYLSMANEATLIYKKTFWEQLGFSEQQSSEGIQFLVGRHWQIAHTDIKKQMICICHSSNTVDKEPWRNYNVEGFPTFDEHKKILDTISL